MGSEQAELRAERLRVAIRVFEVADDYHAGMYREPAPMVGSHDVALFRTASPEDTLLAQACVDAERDLRRRQWGAMETLLGALPPGGDIEDLYDLPAEQAIRALSAAHLCGWLREA